MLKLNRTHRGITKLNYERIKAPLPDGITRQQARDSVYGQFTTAQIRERATRDHISYQEASQSLIRENYQPNETRLFDRDPAQFQREVPPNPERIQQLRDMDIEQRRAGQQALVQQEREQLLRQEGFTQEEQEEMRAEAEEPVNMVQQYSRYVQAMEASGNNDIPNYDQFVRFRINNPEADMMGYLGTPPTREDFANADSSVLAGLAPPTNAIGPIRNHRLEPNRTTEQVRQEQELIQRENDALRYDSPIPSIGRPANLFGAADLSLDRHGNVISTPASQSGPTRADQPPREDIMIMSRYINFYVNVDASVAMEAYNTNDHIIGENDGWIRLNNLLDFTYSEVMRPEPDVQRPRLITFNFNMTISHVLNPLEGSHLLLVYQAPDGGYLKCLFSGLSESESHGIAASHIEDEAQPYVTTEEYTFSVHHRWRVCENERDMSMSLPAQG